MPTWVYFRATAKLPDWDVEADERRGCQQSHLEISEADRVLIVGPTQIQSTNADI